MCLHTFKCLYLHHRVYKQKGGLFSSLKYQESRGNIQLEIISRIYDFHNVLGRNGSEFGLLGKFRDLSSMLRLSSRSRNTASSAYLRKSLAQVSQSYHKTMESRSGNLVNSAKSNSRVASVGVDKVTPFSRSFSLSLSLFHSSFPSYIIPSLYPVALLHRNAPFPFIFYFFLPSLTLFFSFFSFFSHPLPSSSFFQRKFLSPLAFSLERIREYVFQRESWFPH